MLVIKPDQRCDYPDLLSTSQLKRLGLMPAAGSQADAVVSRQIYGSYCLYDKKKCIPYVISEEEKGKRRLAERKRKALYTCPVCNKYLGVHNGFESTREPGMCHSCYSQKREEYREKIKQEKGEVIHKRNGDFYEFLVIDVETTGLSPVYDEILQLAILSNTGDVLFYENFCPYFHISYPEAAFVNGLFYEDMRKYAYIFSYLPRIHEIFGMADKIVGYNVDFDLSFLAELGIDFSNFHTDDVMYQFAEFYGEYDEYKGGYRWKKLSFCANYFGFDFKEHDSLEDCKATLFSYLKMNECMDKGKGFATGEIDV